MNYIIFCILILVVIVIIYTLLTKHKETEQIETKEVDPECCGAHEICDLDLKKLKEEVVYFDDEELDNYKNRLDNQYNEKEIDEFRDILYTLSNKDIREWITSLEIRKISLPEPLKQEVISMLTNE